MGLGSRTDSAEARSIQLPVPRDADGVFALFHVLARELRLEAELAAIIGEPARAEACDRAARGAREAFDRMVARAAGFQP